MTIGSSYTIGDCINHLPFKMGNRQDFGFPVIGTSSFTNLNLGDGSIATVAMLEAIKELTETYEFEELKYQTPVPSATPLALTTGQPVVSIASLMATIAGNALYPQFQTQNIIDLTDVYTFWIWFSGGVNQAGRTLKYRRVTTVDMVSYGITSNVQGNIGVAIPVYYTRFGNILQIGPVPNQNYNFFVRFKIRHPYPVGGSATFVPATLTSSLTGNAVTGVTLLTGGQAYQPSVTIPLIFGASPNGDTATGTINTSAGGVVTGGVTITHAGTGYLTAPAVSTGAIQAQQVFAPDSWQEIFELGALQRLAVWEGASEYIEMFQEQLSKKINATGVMKTEARIAQQQRDETHNERAFSMVINPYTHASR